MANVIFFNLPAHGHTNPTLPLVAGLVGQGDHVVYYSSEEFRPAIERTGATFRPYPAGRLVAPAGGDAGLLRNALLLAQATERLLPQLLPAVTVAQPDYVIHDSLCPWGRALAQVRGLPAIGSVTTFALTEAVLGTLPNRPRLTLS